jgi:hypothetical protein
MKNKPRINLIFSLLLLAGPSLVLGAKYEGASFSDANGSLSFGSRYSFSSSYEQNGNVQEASVSSSESGNFSGRSGILAVYPQPAPVNDLVSVITSSHSIRLDWTAPSGNWYRGIGGAIGYILRYSTSGPMYTDGIFRTAAQIGQNWTPVAVTIGETKVLEGFNPGTTYYFSLESYNSDLVRSEMSNLAGAMALAPLAPMNFKVTATPTGVTMSWIPPTGYSNHIPFNDRFKPAYPYEVKGYEVFRATAAATAPWEQLSVEISSSIFNWIDTVAPGERFFYQVRAFNYAGLGSASYALANDGGKLYFVAPDNASVLEVPAEGTDAFTASSGDPASAYTVEIIPHPEDLSGRVVKSLEFAAYRGGLTKDEDFKLPQMGKLRLYYQTSGGTVIPSGTEASNLSMYFYNHSKWLQLYGQVNEGDKNVELQTNMLGKYQVRKVERLGAFGADFSGLSNRLITPNGAGIKGTIYDLKGAKVADMVPGPISNSMLWDAKAGGQTVPGGVYIYQLEAETKVYNGTVVVIK